MSEFLPVEIVDQIIAKLPVKALLAGKAVCKRWNYVISQPQFAESHFKNQTLTRSLLLSTTPNIPQLHLSTTANTPQLESLELDRIPFGDRASAHRLTSPVTRYNRDVLLLGTCNGFVCACVGFDDFFIWNPSTGEYRPLPFPPYPVSEFGYVSDPPFNHYGGFGYVSATQDYKIILSACMQYNHHADGFQKVDVQIFSLRNEMWERKSSPCAAAVEGQGVTVNGNVHWVKVYYDDEEEDQIVPFNLETGEFGEMITLPSFEADETDNLSVALFSSEGHLCVWHYDKRDASVDYWVMNIYGANDSWSMPYTFNISNESPINFLKPLVVTESIIVLVKCSTTGELELVRISQLELVQIGQQGDEERAMYMNGWQSRDYQHESLMICMTIVCFHCLLVLKSIRKGASQSGSREVIALCWSDFQFSVLA